MSDEALLQSCGGFFFVLNSIRSSSCHTLKSCACLTGPYSVSDAVGLTRLRYLDTQMSCPVGVSTSLVIVFQQQAASGKNSAFGVFFSC